MGLIFSYTCDACGQVNRGGGLDRQGEYVLPDGRMTHVPSEIGWCRDCKVLRPIETLDRDYWAEAIRQVGRQLASIRIKHRWLRKSIVDFEDEFGDDHFRMPVEDTALKRWQAELEEALTEFDFLALRQSGPHCLHCGGTDFVRSGMTHPDCGGTFKAEIAGHISLSGGGRTRTRYSVEGEEF